MCHSCGVMHNLIVIAIRIYLRDKRVEKKKKGKKMETDWQSQKEWNRYDFSAMRPHR